jgi:hypothetical protein
MAALLVATLRLAAASGTVELVPANRVAAESPAWRDVVAAFARQPDVLAQFTEERYFPFRREPARVSGEVRVSRTRGLSLRYRLPEERVVIFDEQGSLVRDAAGQNALPRHPGERASGSLLHVLRLDFAALEKDFEVYGRREAEAWALVLVPRAEETRRNLGNIHVAGEGAVVRAIEIRRSEKQRIEIRITEPVGRGPFSADEVKRYFR